MDNKSIEIPDIEELAQQAQSGVDVSAHFTGRFQAKQQVSIALPLELLRSIDAECQSHNLSRQDWINQLCAEKIRQLQLKDSPEALAHRP
jgi:uncharacterized pyridoxal phosphate-containing UPF0001 family protein